MKKGFKGLLTGLCLAFALLLTGCGVNQKSADKIKESIANHNPMTLEEVKKEIGKPTDDSLYSATLKSGIMFWVDGCKDWEAVEKKLDAGKQLKAIGVTFVNNTATLVVYYEDFKASDRKK